MRAWLTSRRCPYCWPGVHRFNSTSGQLTLTGLADGVHTLEARGSYPNVGVELTPCTTVWTVTTTLPVVTFLHAPPPTSATPTINATFVLGTTADPVSSTFQYYYLDNATSSSSSLSAAGWRNSTCYVLLTDLTPGVTYTLFARCVDAAGNVGPAATYSWRSEACVTAASVSDATPVDLRTVWLDYGARAVTWSPPVSYGSIVGYQYSVDGAPWLPLVSLLVTLSNVTLGVTHEFSVRSVAASVCGGANLTAVLSNATVTWFEYDRPPGRCGCGPSLCPRVCVCVPLVCLRTCLDVCAGSCIALCITACLSV